MTTPTAPEPRYVVYHSTARHQWQIIDRKDTRGQYAGVIGELDDRYPTSKRAIERYCRTLQSEHEQEGQKA